MAEELVEDLAATASHHLAYEEGRHVRQRSLIDEVADERDLPQVAGVYPVVVEEVLEPLRAQRHVVEGVKVSNQALEPLADQVVVGAAQLVVAHVALLVGSRIE